LPVISIPITQPLPLLPLLLLLLLLLLGLLLCLPCGLHVSLCGREVLGSVGVARLAPECCLEVVHCCSKAALVCVRGPARH
jgi:hypothetical protein